MKKTIIIALALMFVASPVLAHRHPRPTPPPPPAVEEPAVGLLPSPQPSTIRYFNERGQVIKEETKDIDGNVLSSWSLPTPTPQPIPLRSYLDDIEDMLNSIQRQINELLKSL